MPKLPKISLLFREFCTLPVTEGYAIWHSISSSQPSKKAHLQNKIRACLDNTNFGNATILPHFRPEKCQKSDPERHEFRERHNSSLPWARESPNPTAKDTNFTQNSTH